MCVLWLSVLGAYIVRIAVPPSLQSCPTWPLASAQCSGGRWGGWLSSEVACFCMCNRWGHTHHWHTHTNTLPVCGGSFIRRSHALAHRHTKLSTNYVRTYCYVVFSCSSNTCMYVRTYVHWYISTPFIKRLTQLHNPSPITLEINDLPLLCENTQQSIFIAHTHFGASTGWGHSALRFPSFQVHFGVMLGGM